MLKLKVIYILFVFFIIIPFSCYAAKSDEAPWVGTSLDGKQCNGTIAEYGPFDYTKRYEIDPSHLSLVEGAHFKPDVENLLESKHRSNSVNPWPDLDYTLRAWPNHPRALLSAVRFQLKIKNKMTALKMGVPAECYLQRAIHFSPEDPAPYALYGHYLHKLGNLEKASSFFKKAVSLDPENAKFSYSYGLLLLDMKLYEDALKYAKIAYSNRKTPPTLKNKLEKLGVWK